MAKASSRVFFCMSSMATSTGVNTVCGMRACTYGYVCLCGVHLLGPAMSYSKPAQGSWNWEGGVGVGVPGHEYY